MFPGWVDSGELPVWGPGSCQVEKESEEWFASTEPHRGWLIGYQCSETVAKLGSAGSPRMLTLETDHTSVRG